MQGTGPVAGLKQQHHMTSWTSRNKDFMQDEVALRKASPKDTHPLKHFPIFASKTLSLKQGSPPTSPLQNFKG